MEDFTSTFGNSAAEAAPVERALFATQNVYAFGVRDTGIYRSRGGPIRQRPRISLPPSFFGGGAIGWLLVLVYLWVYRFLANHGDLRHVQGRAVSRPGIFIVAEAVIFVPLILVATYYSGDASVLMKAGIVTLGLFLGITMTVFITRSDFSSARSSRSAVSRHSDSSSQAHCSDSRSAMFSRSSWSRSRARQSCTKPRTFCIDTIPSSMSRHR